MKMKNSLTAAVIVAACLLTALPASAQRGRVSPHETISAVIGGRGGNRVTITYGRPYSKNPRGNDVRQIWGGLVPYGKAWRMGADEATTLITEMPIVFGETTIPAGVYTLYMVPQETGASKLAFSKRLGKWGIPVDETQDVARVDLKKDTLDPQVDQFTMAVESAPDGGGVIKLMWEKAVYSASFTVKK